MDKQTQPVVFVIDDDPEIQLLLRKLFTLENCTVLTFSRALDALEDLKRYHEKKSDVCKLVVCDLKLPDLDGLSFFEVIVQRKWDFPVIFVTGHASVETAVEALKRGALDYVKKPINLTELSIKAARVFEHQRMDSERKALQRKLDEQIGSSSELGQVVGKSPKIGRVYELVDRVAKSNSSVLITGESGTGKEIVARSIHQKSDRKEFPFVAINCSAIPDQLLESELFGYRKGAFTGANESRAGLFEEAQGGTIFLDEIGDMALGLQAKLLRVLQERKIKPVGDNQFHEIDVRIIAATHKNIRSLVQEGNFREDLFYRICVIPIHLPPLRERTEDIPLMANYFVKKHCEANHIAQKRVSQGALAKLLRLPWPGNIRELENTVERAVLLSDKEWIDENDIQVEIAEVSSFAAPAGFSKLVTLQELECSYIKYILKVTEDSKEKAASILGINRKTLYRKEIEYGL